MSKAIILEPGTKIHMLTVVACVGRKRKELLYRCICECGNETEVPSYDLRKTTKSCGCLVKKHGLYLSRTYGSWRGMIKRCYNPKHKSFYHYGAKGVKVCQPWLDDFQNFLRDVGECPSSKHSIDRIDGTQGYFKENCRWSTAKAQASNRTSNKYLEYNGEKLTYSQWSERLGFARHLVACRVRQGWSVEKIINTPKAQHVRKTGERRKNESGHSAAVWRAA